MKITFDPEMLRRLDADRCREIRQNVLDRHRGLPWFDARCDEHGERLNMRLGMHDDRVYQALDGCCDAFKHDVSCEMSRHWNETAYISENIHAHSLEWWKWQVQKEGVRVPRDWFFSVPEQAVYQWAEREATPQTQRRLAQLLTRWLLAGRMDVFAIDTLGKVQDDCERLIPRETVSRAWQELSERFQSRTDEEARAMECLTQYFTHGARRATPGIVQLLRELGLASPDFAAKVQDVAGLPFFNRPCLPTWRTPAVVAIARRAYEDGQLDLMPVLGDALEEAGGPEEVIRHCREAELHTSGCWVLDWVIGREESLLLAS